MTIEDSRFEDNRADTVGGALDVFGDLTVRDSVFVRNHAQLGAAIRARSLALTGSWLTSNLGRDSTILTGDLTIDRSVVSLNDGRSVIESFQEPADTRLSSSTFERNGGEVLTRGGVEGQVDVVDSRFVDNGGGAISGLAQRVVAERSLFDGNHGEMGGAIWARDAVIDTSSFVRNSGPQGGALQVDESLEATNTTFADNVGDAGAISGGTAEVRLDHVTVGRNVSFDLASVRALGLVARATVFEDDVLSDRTCDVARPPISEGYNVAREDSCGLDAPTDQFVGWSGLGELRDNGGGLPSFFPLADSPLVDVVPRAECAVATDQRGVSRSIGRGCDVGAIEQAFPAAAFGDVPAGLAAPVSWVTSTVNGRPLLPARGGGRFQPSAPLTRAQAVEALYRSVGSPGRDSAGPCPGANDLNTDAVCWAQASHVMNNVRPGQFRPNLAVTRLQWVRVLHRLSGGAPPWPDGPPHGFVDVARGNADVLWATHNGIAGGFARHRFRPSAAVTRGQGASMLWRLAITPSAWGVPPENVMPTSPMVSNWATPG